jgi:hypothetical protein
MLNRILLSHGSSSYAGAPKQTTNLLVNVDANLRAIACRPKHGTALPWNDSYRPSLTGGSNSPLRLSVRVGFTESLH